MEGRMSCEAEKEVSMRKMPMCLKVARHLYMLAAKQVQTRVVLRQQRKRMMGHCLQIIYRHTIIIGL